MVVVQMVLNPELTKEVLIVQLLMKTQLNQLLVPVQTLLSVVVQMVLILKSILKVTIVLLNKKPMNQNVLLLNSDVALMVKLPLKMLNVLIKKKLIKKILLI